MKEGFFVIYYLLGGLIMILTKTVLANIFIQKYGETSKKVLFDVFNVIDIQN